MKKFLLILILCLFAFNKSFACGFLYDEECRNLELIKELSLIVYVDQNHDPKLLPEEIVFLNKVKKTDDSYSCMFLEVSPSAGDAINKFLTGTKYEDSVSLWMKSAGEAMGTAFINIIPDWYLLKLSQLGFKVFGVDIEQGTEDARIDKEAWLKFNRPKDQNERLAQVPMIVEKRNKIMVANVIEKIKTEKCAKSIFKVGAAHIMTHVFGVDQIPVEEFFKSENINVGTKYQSGRLVQD